MLCWFIDNITNIIFHMIIGNFVNIIVNTITILIIIMSITIIIIIVLYHYFSNNEVLLPHRSFAHRRAELLKHLLCGCHNVA